MGDRKIIKMTGGSNKGIARAIVLHNGAKISNMPQREQLQPIKNKEVTFATAEDAKAGREILAQITKHEEDCLQLIHTRHCLIKMVPINLRDDVGRLTNAKRPNYWEYWFKINTKQQAFLMSRETVIENGEIKLRIIFNRDIARTGENDQRGFEAPC